MRVDPVQIVTSGDMSGNISSIGIDVNQGFGFSIQAVFTGSPTGTFKIQWSNDKVAMSQGTNPSANVTNWTDYTGSSQAITASGNYGWICGGDSATMLWVRLVYTFTSGTGTLNATFVGKGV